jgi:hypothetical protein
LAIIGYAAMANGRNRRAIVAAAALASATVADLVAMSTLRDVGR